jgi:hypothetical protein
LIITQKIVTKDFKPLLEKVMDHYQEELNENKDIDIFLLQDNGFWIMANLFRKLFVDPSWCTEQIFDAIITFAKSYIQDENKNSNMSLNKV